MNYDLLLRFLRHKNGLQYRLQVIFQEFQANL
jgi:hypothetical protein